MIGKRYRKNREAAAVLAAALLISGLQLTGCANRVDNAKASGAQDYRAVQGESTQTETEQEEAAADSEGAGKNKTASWMTEETAGAPKLAGRKAVGSMRLDYAACFRIWYYSDGCKVVDIPQSGQYLVVPEGCDPQEKELPAEMKVIRQPLKNIYLAATSAMSLIDAAGGGDSVTLSALEADSWYIEKPKKALEEGRMQYAGKYSEPDYEMLIEKNCDLAVESTMILHAPDVQEMIEDLGIPVLIDRSSYEKDALGRTEWIKLYGALLNREDEAQKFFEEQEKTAGKNSSYEETGRTVAYFAVKSDGTVTIRREDDYIPAMIRKAGGSYVFSGMKNPAGQSATVDISMEEFYRKAVDADYLVFNGTIVGTLKNLDDLIGKNELFREFKAVREGNVWQVDKSMYQSTDRVGALVKDFHIMMTDGDTSELTFLEKLEK